MLRKSSLVPTLPEVMPRPGQKTQMEEPKLPGDEREGFKPSLESGGEEKEECPKKQQSALPCQLQLLEGTDTSPEPRVPSPISKSIPALPKEKSAAIPARILGRLPAVGKSGAWSCPARGAGTESSVTVRGIFAEKSFPRQVMRLFLAWNLLPQLPSAPEC